MTSVERSDVRAAVTALSAERSYVKAHHIARHLDRGPGTHKSIGQQLGKLADEGLVERWSSSDVSRGATWKLTVDDEPEIRADGGHDLAALREGIASTVAADDDRTRHYGAYAFRASHDWNDVETHVSIDYDGEPFWMVIPFGLADVVCNAIEERLDDAGQEVSP